MPNEYPARIYADESLDDGRTFLIQTALILPKGNAEIAFNEILAKKMAAEPKYQRKEFKANKLDAGARTVYQWFLQQTINIIAEITDKTVSRPFTAFDAMARITKGEVSFDKVMRFFQREFSTVTFNDKERRIAEQFATQVVWFHSRLPKLYPHKSAHIEIYLDEQYRSDVAFEESVGLWSRVSASRHLYQGSRKRWEIYTDLLNRVIEDVPTTRAFPIVDKITYVRSETNYLVQAADLLSNLFLNSLRHRLGITDATTQMKYAMLCSVMDQDPIHAELLRNFVADGRKAVCTNPDLLSSVELIGA